MVGRQQRLVLVAFLGQEFELYHVFQSKCFSPAGLNQDAVTQEFSELVGEILASCVSLQAVTVECSENSRKKEFQSQSSIALQITQRLSVGEKGQAYSRRNELDKQRGSLVVKWNLFDFAMMLNLLLPTTYCIFQEKSSLNNWFCDRDPTVS